MMIKKKVLFVCLGNICRSPSAEIIFKKYLEEKKLDDNYVVDSAGIGGWHVGELPDKRMRKHAEKRGYDLTSISRKFDPTVDFDSFDIIIGMDDENIISLKEMARNQDDKNKIHKMTDFSKEWSYTEVPDPYYGGAEGFELVIDLLEDACEGLLKKLKE